MDGCKAPETDTNSKSTYKRNVRLRRRNWSRKATTVASAELVAHKPHCSNRNLLQLFALVLCAPLPTRRKLRFHLCNSCISSLVFVVSEPCVRSTRLRGILLRAPRRRSGTAFSRFVLPRACQPFVACNELAIDTKSIASVLPHAERTPRVPSNEVQRGNGGMGATRKTTRPVDEL